METETAPAGPLDPADRETLLRNIESGTSRRVRNLDVALSNNRVIVSGRSNSYYVKQLVTQAVLATIPQAFLVNNVRVVTGPQSA